MPLWKALVMAISMVIGGYLFIIAIVGCVSLIEREEKTPRVVGYILLVLLFVVPMTILLWLS